MSEFEQLQEYIDTLPTTAQQLVVDCLAFLKQRYFTSASPTPQPLDLDQEPFVGMWSDYPEMQDSTDWVRQARQQHWRNQHDCSTGRYRYPDRCCEWQHIVVSVKADGGI